MIFQTTITYQYRDHLGNNRLSYADTNGNGKIDTPYNSGVTVWEDGFEDKSTENGDWESEGAMYGRDITGFDTSFSHTGIKSGYITIDTDGQYADYYVHSNEWVAIDISEPTLYRFSGWVYAEPSLYRTRMAMFMNTAEETTYYTAVSEHMEYQKGEWVYVEKVVMVQPEIKTLNFRIDIDSYNDGTAWFDDLKIERLGSHNEIVSETNYYPFGMVHKGYNELVTSSSLGEQWKFNGVELNEDMDLGLYEMPFRQYNPTIGRFTGVDALSEERYWVSNFNFGQNNPILRVDPTGLLDDIFINTRTNQLTVIKTDDNFDRVIVDGKNIGKAEKGVTKAEYEAKGYSSNEVRIIYGKNVDTTQYLIIQNQLLLM